MPETRGLVQRVKIRVVFPFPPGRYVYWVYIGPSPTNTRLFTIDLDDQDPGILRRRSMAELLSGALLARREVIVTHPEDSGAINALDVVPG
jgi:hypothetical protein